MMHPLLQKLSFAFILVTLLLASPLYAQQNTVQPPDQPFIQQGKFLTGFSFSFINASREEFNQDFEREFTEIAVQIDGLYFVSDQIGVGPLLGYRFQYIDLEDPFRSGPPDDDIRFGQFEFGVKGGWFIPATRLFNNKGDTQFFIDGGASLLRQKLRRENIETQDVDYRLGFQLGTGFLFPVGKRIAIITKLGFQTHEEEFAVPVRHENRETTFRTETKWIKEVALSVGLKVTF